MTPVTAGRARSRASRNRRRGAIPATLAGLVLLGLTACSSGPGPSITVQGKVVDITGNPIPNANILVNSTPTSTATDGTFAVTGVTTPYDVAVYLDASIAISSRPTVMVYQGLTLTQPTLTAPAGTGPYYGDNVGGTIGTQLTQTPSEKGLLIAGGPGYSYGGTEGLDYTDTVNGAFGPLSLTWFGGASRPTTVFALTADVDSNGMPTAYTGYAATSLTLADGVDQTAVDDTLSSNGLTTLQETGTVTGPSGYTLVNSSNCSQNNSCLNVGSTLLLRFTKGATGATFAVGRGTTSLNVPHDAGGTIGYALAARAEPAGATNDDIFSAALFAAPNAGAGTSNSLTLLTPPDPLSPSNGATGVTTGTSFSWGALSNSVYAVSLGPSSSSDTTDPQIIVLTAGTQMTLPDVSALGVQLPSQVQYDYNLSALGPFASVDAAVNQPLLLDAAQEILGGIFSTGATYPIMIPFFVPDLRVAQGARFTFTTQ